MSGCLAEIGEGDQPALEEIGLVLDNGLTMPNGLNLANGFNLANGVNLANGFNLANGVDLLNGINLANAAPSIAPPPGSGLEQWIDEDPPVRLRTIQYLVECALPATARVEVRYRDSVHAYGGRTGLATSWQGGLMSSAEQEKVSACLLSRINVEGKTVMLDLFGPMPGFNSATHAELDAFPAPEGVFFGNLFAATPAAYVCGLDAISRDEFRACIGADCGVVTAVGRNELVRWGYWGGSSYVTVFVLDDCFDRKVCTKASLTGGYAYASRCSHGGATWNYPITSHLALAMAGEECYGSYQCQDGLDCLQGTCQ